MPEAPIKGFWWEREEREKKVKTFQKERDVGGGPGEAGRKAGKEQNDSVSVDVGWVWGVDNDRETVCTINYFIAIERTTRNGSIFHLIQPLCRASSGHAGAS